MSSWTVSPESIMVVLKVIFSAAGRQAEGTEDALDIAPSGVEESAACCDMSLQLGKVLLELVVKGLQAEWEVVK